MGRVCGSCDAGYSRGGGILVIFAICEGNFVQLTEDAGSHRIYRDQLKGVQILLSNSQAGPGRKVQQEQEEISRNHVQAF